ncbi:uncharacterized protein [Coffea arabica]|uniref:Uncharacterized protein isoform X2 n=1 Tax=Coffea arabica TaxID=13443 RepID=A0A6P6T614_COFAR|nr:uncharacterized protein LOC113698217 isoform X2 [Coffea arabica]
MAGMDSEKQLLSLIRNFASENSHGEHEIVNLKKRIEELRSELIKANAELEDAKLGKESSEQELKGYEVELAMNEASIQTLEARINSVQDAISAVGSELEALRNQGDAERDDFIDKMLELNARIRKFHESVVSDPNKEDSCGTTSSKEGVSKTAAEVEIVQSELDQTVSRIKLEKRAYETEQGVHKLVQQDLSDLERKASLMESIMKEDTELRELTRQTSELEEKCASFRDELQRRFQCPSCQRDNSEALDVLLQTIRT